MAWLAVCLLLLAVTWLPLLGVHAYRMSRADVAAGVVIAVFAPTLPAQVPFERVAAAGGTMVRPVAGWPRAWLVQSSEAGFAGRLRARGAWAVFAPELLSPRAFLQCFRLVSTDQAPPGTSGWPSRPAVSGPALPVPVNLAEVLSDGLRVMRRGEHRM